MPTIRRHLFAALLLAASTLRPVALAAQVAPPPAVPRSASPASTTRVAIGGTVGGIAGLYLGIALGRLADPKDPEAVRWGSAIGAGIGTVAGIALGAHAANRGRGDLGTVVARAALPIVLSWAGSYAAFRLGPDLDVFLLPIGIAAGIAAATHYERKTTR
jgi:hypothetical protein